MFDSHSRGRESHIHHTQTGSQPLSNGHGSSHPDIEGRGCDSLLSRGLHLEKESVESEQGGGWDCSRGGQTQGTKLPERHVGGGCGKVKLISFRKIRIESLIQARHLEGLGDTVGI